jgi:glycolate oxidase FAD binding subunit
MTEVTIKVLPAAETEETLLIRGLEPAQAVEAMTTAMGSACDVSGAAHLPPDVATSIPAVAGAAGGGITALRLEGFSPSVVHRRGVLQALMKPFGDLATIDASVSRPFWKAVRDVTPFAAGRGGMERPLWRISTAPDRGAELGATIAQRDGAKVLYDWAGGLLWLTLAASDDAGAACIGPAVAASGGHATLIRAPASMRAAIGVFAPQEAGLAALTKRVKESFDPKGVLNPGRMWAGV